MLDMWAEIWYYIPTETKEELIMNIWSELEAKINLRWAWFFVSWLLVDIYGKVRAFYDMAG
jgi:hypothetical protein